MPQTYLDSLKARRLKISQELEAVTADKPGGLPNVSGEGEADHGEYRRRLLAEEKQINDEIDREQARVDGPAEFHSTGRLL